MSKPTQPKRRFTRKIISWLTACCAGTLLIGQSAPIGAGPQRVAIEEQDQQGPILQVIGCKPSDVGTTSEASPKSLSPLNLSRLRAPPAPEVVTSLSVMTRFRYGRVRKGGALAYAEPNLRSAVRGFFAEGQPLAFCPILAGIPADWLQRADGSYMQKARIELHSPSLFMGEESPATPLAFLIRTTRLRRDDGVWVTMSRHSWLPVLLGASAPLGMVRVLGGLLPRSAVRLVLPHARPQQVPPGARWIYLDRREQVMSAYEGDSMVLATLISTGKTAMLAPAGLYRVFYKVVHDTMHGESDDSYLLEEVPFAQYFFRGMSLHGAFWHDDFGSKTSHGCINLSLRDAEWLFGWAPPAWSAGLPAALPLSSGKAALWVLVQ